MMINLYRKLKQHGVEMTTRVTADGEHVRFGFKKNGIPGGRIFSFWELENLSEGAIEDQLIRALESHVDICKRLEEFDDGLKRDLRDFNKSFNDR